MCGIAGFIDDRIAGDQARILLERMTSSIRHRGPDSDGFLVTPGVCLGMRRLRIIDLQTGEQPVSNEDGSVSVVFNGEIYNFEELRAGLEAEGHIFSTGSDTEVIVHLYEKEGIDFVRRLRGMFALALMDMRTGSLVLARDRFGIKPLFIAEDGARLAFASEMKALLELPWVDRAWNPLALRAYLSLGYIPAPWTAFSGIRKFEPGTLEIWKHGGQSGAEMYRSFRYWEPGKARISVPEDLTEAAEKLEELLLESVRIHLRSDVPLGAFLSGGIDSTAVVAFMRRCGAADVRTFTVGFDTPAFDETAYARKAASILGTVHTERVLTGSEAASMLEAAGLFDEPFADSSAIPTLLVSRLAREQVTVALSGDGGDELFAGYSQYRTARRYKYTDWVPRGLRKVAGSVLTALIPETSRGAGFARRLGTRRDLRHFSLVSEESAMVRGALSSGMEDFLRSGGPDSLWTDRFSTDGGLLSAQVADQVTYLPDDILTKVDRCSMAVSLEARVPLLDHHLAEYANSLPDCTKLYHGISKRILRLVAGRDLPEGFFDRPKTGFGIPLRKWLVGELACDVEGTLMDCSTGILDPPRVRALLQALRTGEKDISPKVWKLFCLCRWASGTASGRPW